MYINLAKNVISRVLETPKINPTGGLRVHPKPRLIFSTSHKKERSDKKYRIFRPEQDLPKPFILEEKLIQY